MPPWGWGEAIAVKFAEEGARVACVDVKGEPNEETVARIRKSEGEAYAMVGDVGVATDAERMVMEANDILGGIDILVNNAGVVPSRETVINTSEEDWDETIRVNVKGVFLMSKSVLPIMVEHGGGAIVNMSSIAGLVGLPVRPGLLRVKGRGGNSHQTDGARLWQRQYPRECDQPLVCHHGHK